MKTTLSLELAVAALIAGTSINAWPQGGGASAPAGAPGAAETAASATAAPAKGRKADRALRRKVYAAIGKHTEISAGDISVMARDGAVTLTGSVTDSSQVGKVAEIASGVAGVTSVNNKLTVRKPLGGM